MKKDDLLPMRALLTAMDREDGGQNGQRLLATVEVALGKALTTDEGARLLALAVEEGFARSYPNHFVDDEVLYYLSDAGRVALNTLGRLA